MDGITSALDFKRAWGDFVDDVGKRKGGWDWFATLTFRGPTLEEINRGFTQGRVRVLKACL